MIAQSSIKSVIDKASLQYRRCWITLRKVKLLDVKRIFGKDFLNFQPTLCQALLQLEKTYQTIAWEKEGFIQRKRDLSETWFNQRMKTLARYQEAIEKCIYIGKSLGDSFAWIFYEHERALLIEHLKHEELSHLPSGLGAVGELAFVKNVQGFGRCLVIYHGITTFLRLGDVSFYDFSSRKVVDLGELKTRQIDKEHVEVTVVFAGWQPEKPTMPIGQAGPIPAGNDVPTKRPLLANLSPKMKGRLGRQLRAMATSLGRRDKEPDREASMNIGIHIEELRQLYSKLKTSRFVYQRVGPGLLLMAYRNRSQSLSSKLIGRSRINIDKSLAEVPGYVRSILDETRSDNVLYNSSFYYDSHGRALSLAGTVPVFWWPLQIDFIRAVIFQDVFVITIFNPLYLLAKLERIGWKAEHDTETGIYTLTKEGYGSNMRMENFSYFMKLIQNYLFREEAVVDIINDAFATMGKEDLPTNTRIELHVQQVFGSDPKLSGHETA